MRTVEPSTLPVKGLSTDAEVGLKTDAKPVSGVNTVELYHSTLPGIGQETLVVYKVTPVSTFLSGTASGTNLNFVEESGISSMFQHMLDIYCWSLLPLSTKMAEVLV